MICLPVEVKPESTHPIALWLAVTTFQPFETGGRPYRAGDRLMLAGTDPALPMLDGWDALLFEDVTGEVPYVVGQKRVSIFGLSPT